MRPRGVLLVSFLMIVFGLIEVATGFTHSFAGISTSASELATLAGVVIGAFYSVAGILTLTMRLSATSVA
jgi:hypothetical protein